MAKENIIVGLDVGTCFIRVVVAKLSPETNKPQIIGIGQAPSFGLRRGVVVDIEEAVKNISEAVQQAERSSGIAIDRVNVSISGSHIEAKPSRGVVAVSRADNEISREDVDRAIANASAISVSPNREIFHVLPRNYIVDTQGGIKEPVGMNGMRLEVDAMMIEGSMPFIKNLNKCVSEAGLEAEEMVLAPLASSRSALSKRQRELGVLALDMGGGTTGMTVFEEGELINSCILPVGSLHITNDIAIGLRSDIDIAEKVKLEYGSAISSEIGKKDMIDLAKLGMGEKGLIPRLAVAQIIEARIAEVLELANKELKKIDRQGLLPAGVVLVGGGAKMPGLVDLAKETLRLPVQIGFPQEIEGVIEEVDDPSFATAVGLIHWGVQQHSGRVGRRGISMPQISVGTTVGKIKGWLKGFMP